MIISLHSRRNLHMLLRIQVSMMIELLVLNSDLRLVREAWMKYSLELLMVLMEAKLKADPYKVMTLMESIREIIKQTSQQVLGLDLLNRKISLLSLLIYQVNNQKEIASRERIFMISQSLKLFQIIYQLMLKDNSSSVRALRHRDYMTCRFHKTTVDPKNKMNLINNLKSITGSNKK
jgi:hypothetical protein